MPAAPTLPATQRPRAGSPSDSPVWHCCSHAPVGAGRPCAAPLAYNLQLVGKPRHLRALHPELHRTCRCDIGGRVGSPRRTQSTLRVALRLSLTIYLTRLPGGRSPSLLGDGGLIPPWVTQAVRHRRRRQRCAAGLDCLKPSAPATCVRLLCACLSGPLEP
jgi:hypothetical protein